MISLTSKIRGQMLDGLRDMLHGHGHGPWHNPPPLALVAVGLPQRACCTAGNVIILQTVDG